MIDEIIQPFGITNSDFFGLLGFIFNSCGMAGGICMALVLGKYPSLFKHMAIAVPVATLCTLALFTAAVYQGEGAENFIAVAVGLNGFSSLSIFAVAYEMAVLQTEPYVGEAMAVSILNMSANLIGIFFVIGFTIMMSNKTGGPSIEKSLIMLGIFAVILIIDIILMCTAKVERQFE